MSRPKREAKPNNIINRIEDDDMDGQMNDRRAKAGIKPIKFIWCGICKQSGSHFYWNCPNSYCSLCLQKGHIIKYCPLRLTCQWCGKNHYSKACTDEDGLVHKANATRKCAICKKLGHIASECTSLVRTVKTKRGWPKRKKRFRYKFRKLK